WRIAVRIQICVYEPLCFRMPGERMHHILENSWHVVINSRAMKRQVLPIVRWGIQQIGLKLFFYVQSHALYAKIDSIIYDNGQELATEGRHAVDSFARPSLRSIQKQLTVHE